MKKSFFILIVCLVTLSASFAQSRNSGLLKQRNQYFQYYKNFKDTLTIRTWLNMVELSNRLEAVVLIDNLLLDSLLVGTPTDANLEARVQELSTVKDQLITDNARLNAENTSILNQKSNYIFSIVVIILVLIFVVIAWIRILMKFKHIEKFSGRSNEKLLDLKQKHKEELDLLKDEIQKLKEDQLLMENTSSQMKKSYDILKEKMSNDFTSEGPSNDSIEEVRKEMEEISEEVSSILEEKQRIEDELKLTYQELLKYQSANKTMEDELIKNQDTTKSIEDELDLLLRKLKNE